MIRELLPTRFPGGKKGKTEKDPSRQRGVTGYPCREFNGVQMLVWVTGSPVVPVLIRRGYDSKSAIGVSDISESEEPVL